MGFINRPQAAIITNLETVTRNLSFFAWLVKPAFYIRNKPTN